MFTSILVSVSRQVVSRGSSWRLGSQLRWKGTAAPVIASPRRQEQRELFNHYLQRHAGAVDLFQSLDLNYNGKISVKEMQYFADSLEAANISSQSIKMLSMLGSENEMPFEEFEMWLSVATRGEKGDNKDAQTTDVSNVSSTEHSDGKVGLQAMIWEEWLATGRNAEDLFHAIDLDHSESISVNEINTFLTVIKHRGLDMEDVNELQELGNDHQLSLKEFIVWLSGATEPQYHVSGNRVDAEGCAPAGSV